MELHNSAAKNKVSTCSSKEDYIENKSDVLFLKGSNNVFPTVNGDEVPILHVQVLCKQIAE